MLFLLKNKSTYLRDTTLECSAWRGVEPALEIFALRLKLGHHRRVGVERQKLVEERNPFVQLLGEHRQRLGGIIILIAKIQVDPPDLAEAASQRRFFRGDSVEDMGLNSTQCLGDGGPCRRRDAAFSCLEHQ